MGRAGLLAIPVLALIALAVLAGGLSASGRPPHDAPAAALSPAAAPVPGLRAGALMAVLAGWGLACDRPSAAPGGVGSRCRGRKPGVDYLATLSGEGPDRVDQVEAT